MDDEKDLWDRHDDNYLLIIWVYFWYQSFILYIAVDKFKHVNKIIYRVLLVSRQVYNANYEFMSVCNFVQ